MSKNVDKNKSSSASTAKDYGLIRRPHKLETAKLVCKIKKPPPFTMPGTL